MAPTCEVCGSPIKGPPSAVEIDGAILRVCQNCARRGRPVSIAPKARAFPQQSASRHRASEGNFEPALDIDPDYAIIVRRAREALGLTQEALGRMINAKPSVISHVETGKIKPDMVLARTLMHYLKVNLLVPSSDLDSYAR